MAPGKQRFLGALAACALLAAVICVGYVNSPGGRAASLEEIDGITLDKNAMRSLSGHAGGDAGDNTFVANSHKSSKQLNKMLKNGEDGEIDGIALDKHAMSELGHRNVHIAGSSPIKQEHRGSAKKVDRAQQLLDMGKQDLDARNWHAAVSNFAKAESIWRDEGSPNYQWARTLKLDVLRGHPNVAGAARSSKGPSAMQKKIANVEKQLSSGHAFRSLYGLLRDQSEGGKHQIAKQAGGTTLKLMPARTMSLAQKAHQMSGKLETALKEAENRLKRRSKMTLLREEAALVKQAKAIAKSKKSSAAAIKALATDGQGVSNAPQGAIMAWSGQQVPKGAQLRWSAAAGPAGPTAQQGALRGRGRAPTQQLSYYQMPPVVESTQLQAPQSGYFAPKPAPYDGGSPFMEAQTPVMYENVGTQASGNLFATSSAQSLAQMHSGSHSVPVVNINLPAGEKVPPGQYRMDGNMVQDLAGHWDFVGNLLPMASAEPAEEVK